MWSSNLSQQNKSSSVNQGLAGGGEMGALIRSIDWSKSGLGSIEHWPQSLQTAVGICLSSRFPILIWWGEDLTMIYNDAYRPVLGTMKHPAAMGQRGRECWPEIWHIIGPMLEGVLRNGEATWSDDQMLPLERNGFPEECYFTFSYSPIWDEVGKVGGVFTAVFETTGRVIGERRLRTLRELGEQAAEGTTVEEACRLAGKALARNPTDIPFSMLYLLNEDATQARLVDCTGVEAGTAVSPGVITIGNEATPWPLKTVLLSGLSHRVDRLHARFPAVPPGPWPEPAHTALVLPLKSSGGERCVGFLIVGVSSRLILNDDYIGFFDLVAGQVSTAIASAEAHEAERKQAEALAELDRAKTVFFNDVSHEFRTPLTLIIEPLEDLLNGSMGQLSAEQSEFVKLIHRNALRLLKLVNMLLDFSRIEANRIEASYEPVDLAEFTTDLASMFRSAIERAGLKFIINCPPLPELIYVDREMWEKIVLNLLSNAFKFTFEGAIEVSLKAFDNAIEFQVRDTGTGIPAQELPNIFKRFHRIRDTRARTYEGSGIGLALVQDLVRLHGGTIQVESQPDAGTTFTVSIPRGYAHLPPDRIQAQRTLMSTSFGAAPFVEEALRWLPDAPKRATAEMQIVTHRDERNTFSLLPATGLRKSVSAHTRIILADDNADMRNYLYRMLSSFWQVEAYPDGLTALAAAQRQPPSLLLTDVMMPGMNGFELLRAIRADPNTRTVPVILISARAGEEATVEGLEAGADDYLVKPFSARELVARINAQLEMAQLRKQQAAEMAAIEERQRIARDLHDAVSQTLFTASVLAQSLPRLAERDPEKLLPNLLKLNNLNRAALAEMRTLLLELLPSAMEKARLSELLRHLVDVARGRITSLNLSLQIDGDEPENVPLDVRKVFYRVAQESLNNIVKHSRATQASLSLQYYAGRIQLQVRDNGRGFDGRTISSGIGLDNMRQRACHIGAALQIESNLGQGTDVSLEWEQK